MISVKICGLKTSEHIADAAKAGARYIGFVFFEKSPRFVTNAQARELAVDVPLGIMKVGLFVDPSDAFLDDVLANVPLDMIQLHGEESPLRVAEIRKRYGLPIMKVFGVSQASDLDDLESYSAADQFLFDTKPPKDADLPGGNGIAFDWTILEKAEIKKPWMLAGGLNAENLAQAVELSGALQVDVSSGVESAKGIKDKKLINEFITAARKLK